MTDACPDTAALQDLLDDPASHIQESSVELHVKNCFRCQQRLDVLTQYPALAFVGQRDSTWSRSHSGAVYRHVTAALAADSHPSINILADPRSGTDLGSDLERRTPDIPGYDILNRIGTGGSSDVYRAFHRQLRRVVALKISRERALPEQRDRFRREAEALARLRHSGIIQIYETGQIDGSIFMALEFEESGSLSQFLRGEPQSATVAARFVAEAASAVHEAHQQGLIHRDLKPGNLLLHAVSPLANQKLLDDYTPKVTDFGLVKQIAEESALTASRDVLGTPSYMAPEQVAGQSPLIGPATDVYALGAVLYEMLTGRPPFRAASAIDTVVQVRFDEPVPPSRLIRSVPRDLETVCLKCLEKEPSRRYATAADLAADLTRFVDGRPVKARPMRWPIRMWRWMRRNPRVAILGAVIFALLSALAIFGPVIAYRQSELRKHAEIAEAKALVQWDRADNNLLAANEAIWQATLIKVADLERVPDAESARLQLKIIDSTMLVLEKARAKDPDLPSHRLRWGMALYFHGRAACRSGDFARAESDLNAAAAVMERLAQDRPDQLENRVISATIQYERVQLAVLRREPNAEQRIRDVLAGFDDLTKTSPQFRDGWVGLAESCRMLADNLEITPGHDAEITGLLTRFVAIQKQMTETPAIRTPTPENRLQVYLRLGKHLRKCGHDADADKAFQDGLALRTPADSTATPFLMALRSQTAEAYAHLLAETKRLDAAHQQASTALRLASGLTDLVPEKADYGVLRVRGLLALARIEVLQGHPDAAKTLLDDATTIEKRLPLPTEVKDLMRILRQEMDEHLRRKE